MAREKEKEFHQDDIDDMKFSTKRITVTLAVTEKF